MKADSAVSVVEGKLTTSFINEPPQKHCRLFSFMGNIGSTSTSSSNETNIEKEVKDYLSEVCLPEDSNPLLYWQTKSSDMLTLGTLAKKY